MADLIPIGETATETEAFMESIGTRFVDVSFLFKDGHWHIERHVADPETLTTTIDMSASRFGARAAVWADLDDPDLGWWCWRFRASDPSARVFPNKEAAEMFAMHSRG